MTTKTDQKTDEKTNQKTKQLRLAGAMTATTLLLLGASAFTAGAALAANTTTVSLKDGQQGSAASAFDGGGTCSG
jgi:hypothetical protein